jgi:hypothetical protein
VRVVWARLAVINPNPSTLACRGVVYESIIDKYSLVKRNRDIKKHT